MKKNFLYIFIFLLGLNTYSQPITVSTTTYTVPQLVNNILFASPTGGSSSCVGTISNITWSTGTNFGSTPASSFPNGIGYFQYTNPNFPLSSGVILSTGNALDAPGPNTTTQGNGINSWLQDDDLFNYINGLGIDPGLIRHRNATKLEFDFTPLTTTMSFDFLFASEEYGTFQCDYSDAFAFFLTDITAGTSASNIALVPGTTTPISVVKIRDNAFNNSCPSVNPTFFGNYNGGVAAATAATNFNGETVLMTASSSVIPNHVYHIKLVIADRNDNDYDSAVFLGGGSFNIGNADIVGTGSHTGTTDFTIAGSRAVCSSEALVIQAGLAQIPGVTYSWTLNTSTPVGTNSYQYTATQAGTYTVTLTYPGGCQQTDSIIIEYTPSLTLGTASDLTQCSTLFNLTNNNSSILNGLTNSISFHHSLLQAQQLAFPILNPTTYNGLDGEIIYAAVEDTTTGCIVTTQFTLHIDPTLCITPPIAVTPSDMNQYETIPNTGVSVFDFTVQTSIIYGANAPADYTVTYYPTLADANAGTNPITGINSFSNTLNPQRIYAVLSENALPTNFTIVSFQLIVVALPTVSISGPTSVCDGSSATITFTGTPNATVNFTFDGNPRQIPLGSSGTNIDVTPPLNSIAVYTLVNATIVTSAGTITQPQTGSATVNITPPPVINTPSDYVVCDDNNDGNSCLFDLSTKINEITGGDPAIQIDFYETSTSTSPVGSTFPYCNIVPGIQEIFVRAFNSGTPDCYSTTTLQLVVN